MMPTRVAWTAPDRARQEAWRDEVRAKLAAGELRAGYEPMPEFVVHHSGTMIAVAHDRAPARESGWQNLPHVGWVALVIRDSDGHIVELDPTTLRLGPDPVPGNAATWAWQNTVR